MHTIDKANLTAQLGKGSFWFPIRLTDLTYCYGIDVLDQVRQAQPSTIPAPLTITCRPAGLELSILHKFSQHTVGLAYADLRRVAVEVPEEVVEQRERSVIGRAVLGGLLLGPLGAVIGGMSGLKPGSRISAGDALLTIEVEQGGQSGFFVATLRRLYAKGAEAFIGQHLAQYLTTRENPISAPLARECEECGCDLLPSEQGWCLPCRAKQLDADRD